MNALASRLVDIAIKIGRWILDVAARRGGRFLADYLDERAGTVFARRLASARKRLASAKAEVTVRRLERRIAWLVGRIARWKAAATWLRAKAAQLDNKAIAAICSLPQVKGLPDCAALEAEPR